MEISATKGLANSKVTWKQDVVRLAALKGHRPKPTSTAWNLTALATMHICGVTRGGKKQNHQGQDTRGR